MNVPSPWALGFGVAAIVCAVVALLAIVNERWVLGAVFTVGTLYCIIQQMRRADP